MCDVLDEEKKQFPVQLTFMEAPLHDATEV